jgi:hypothetical protein
MATYYPSPLTTIIQVLSNTGVPLSGGFIYTYAAGTTTPTPTYTDYTGTTLNANPIVLSAAGRPVSSSGAPVGIYIGALTYHKAVITDSSGNVVAGGNSLDWLLGINDPSNTNVSLAVTSAPPGVDLIGNAVKSYTTFAQMRAAPSAGLSNGAQTGQSLIAVLEGGSSIGDALGGAFYWNTSSTTADDGVNVIKVTAIATGRWIRITTPATTPSTGSWSATLTGMASGGTGTLYYNIVGNICSIYTPTAITGTSNTTAMTLSNLPAPCQPAGQRVVVCVLTDNVAGTGFGTATILNSATVTFGTGVTTVTGVFSNTGTKGLAAGFQLVYNL